MQEPALVFETDPRHGSSCLRALKCAVAASNPTDSPQEENQLRVPDEGLVHRGKGHRVVVLDPFRMVAGTSAALNPLALFHPSPILATA
jgi:hypothetical protein